ncbi:hypothetical protein MKEN_00597400 [Mycena kentingensis (nom. inval.)]|nr:hypothetical protein MKEN_00597400 [Mycena kentingensis (nom. inval.)]
MFACCCKRRKDAESKPLLREERPQTRYSSLERLAEGVGALNSGKLPSQDQFSALLQQILRSSVLTDLPGTPGLALHVRKLIDALLRLGLEKNYDDKLQDLWWLASQTDDLTLETQLLVDGEPLQFDNDINRDALKLVQSLKSLSKLALTSSAFRMFLSDILATTRETISEAATQVGQVAGQVQAAAVDIAKTAELSDVAAVRERVDNSLMDVQTSVGVAHENIGTLGDDSADRARDIVVGRVQELVSQARQNPEHRAAIATIIRLSRKYSQKLSALSQHDKDDVNAQLDISEPLYNAISDVKVLLERLASNHSLDPLLAALTASITDILEAPEGPIRRYLSEIASWFSRALAEPHFATSRLGTRTAEQLYDSGRALLAAESNAKWARDIRALVAETQTFFNALESDKATQRFIGALHRVSTTLTGLVSSARTRRNALLRDAFGWLIPRLLRSLRALPMPRIEFQNPTIDLALDLLLLSSDTSLAPDHIRVENYNEVILDMTGAETTPHTSSRTSIHVDGVRCTMSGIGYYVNYKGLVPYADEGLLDIDAGEGLAVDLELETREEERASPGEPLFRLLDATVSIPGLSFGIRKSTHWILNTLLVQPLATPIVRVLVQRAFKQQAAQTIEWADRLVSAVVEDADRRASGQAPTMEDYWKSLLVMAPAFFESRGSAPVNTESHLAPTMKGVVKTTTAVPDADDSEAEAEETVLAIGVAAQLFPDRGLPEDAVEAAANEAATEIRGAVEHTAELAGEAVRVREELERSEARKAKRERFEQHRGGWRSTAFDLE